MDLSKSTSAYSNISAPLKSASSSWKRGLFLHLAGLLLVMLVALAAIFWSSQMVYFLFYFMSRPVLPDGSWPWIGYSYAGFPFISCIGAVRDSCFKSVGITVFILLWTAFSIDYIIGRRSPVGKWWRLGKLVTASISSVFLIALAFASTDGTHKLHLIFTSFQIIFMAMSKGCDWNLNRDMRERTPNNQCLKKIKLWKRTAAVIAIRKYTKLQENSGTSLLTMAKRAGSWLLLESMPARQQSRAVRSISLPNAGIWSASQPLPNGYSLGIGLPSSGLLPATPITSNPPFDHSW